MLEPRKREALDGKTWWCVFNTETTKWSTSTCFGKYKRKKDCQLAIDLCTKGQIKVCSESTINKQEIELIKKMVIQGIYKVCIMNDYDSTIFNKFKKEQEVLFANYELNKAFLELKDIMEDIKD